MKSLKLLIVLGMGITILSAESADLTIKVPASATVSWKDMVKKQALNPDFGYEEKKVIPFMEMKGFKYIDIDSSNKANAFESDDVEQSSKEKSAKKFVTSDSFLALPDNNRGIPPDTMGAVGPNYAMTMLNTQVKIQNKVGSTIGSVVSLATFWQSVSTSPFDSTLLFDKNSNQWIAIAEDFDKNILVAATVTDDPTGTWKFWKFSGASDDGKSWPDFPRVGINHKWIAVTANMFADADNSWTGTKMWTIDKSTIGSNTLGVKAFPDNFDDAGNGAGFTLVPAVTLDDTQDDLYIVDSGWRDNSSNNWIRLSKLSGSTNNPVWSVVGSNQGYFQAPINFNYQPKASQKGTVDKIDTGDTRTLNAVFTNGKLWFTHCGGLPADAPDRAAIFWYQVNPTDASVAQSGTIDPGADGYVFMPTIAVNKHNDAVIGFSHSSPDIYVQAAYTSRSASDPSGNMSPMVISKNGEDSYAKDLGSGTIRWGDYSATVVDPTNDNIFWTLQEYAATSVGSATSDDRWGTWWIKVDSDATTTNIVITPILYLLQ